MKKMWIMLAVVALGLAATVAASGCILNAGRETKNEKVEASANPEEVEATTETPVPVPPLVAKADAAMNVLGSKTLDDRLIDKLDPLFAGGVWFMIIGGAIFALASKAVGGSLVLMGFVMGGTGIFFGQFSRAVLVVFAVVGCFLLWEALTVKDVKGKLDTTEKATEAIVEAVQNAPGGKAVKEAIADKGTLTERLVRAVVDPIKDRLAEAGKI